MTIFLVNGKETQMIPIMDRGMQFGDGCFTTASVYDGEVIMFFEHMDRLRNTCKRLHISFLHWVQLEDEVRQIACSHQRAALKIMITRGKSGYNGYSHVQCENPTRIISVLPWPSHYDLWKKEGISMSLSPIRLGRNPHLAGLKHLNRLEQVLIRFHLEKMKSDEAIVLDSEGLVTECCSANIFWRKKDTVYTPRLDQAGVSGIMRQFLLSVLVSSSFEVKEVQAKEEAVICADEIIICNALMPIIPVRIYKENKFFSRKLFTFLSSFVRI